MGLLSGKVFVIIYDGWDNYEIACELYKNLVGKGIVTMIIFDKETLNVIENNEYDLRYIFIHSCSDVQIESSNLPAPYFYDKVNPYHFLFDGKSADEVIRYFEYVEEELSV